MKKIIGMLFLLLSCSLAHTMERGLSARYIFGGKSVLTPEQESYLNRLPADLRAGLLRNYIIHNVIEESPTLDEAVKKIEDLGQEGPLAGALANDIALLDNQAPIGWLAKQDIEYVMKYYVSFLQESHALKNATALEKRIPALQKIEKIFTNLNDPFLDPMHVGPIVVEIRKIAQESDTEPFVNSYSMTEYFGDLLAKKLHVPFYDTLLITATPGAAKYIKKKGWPIIDTISQNIRKLMKPMGRDVGRLLFLVKSLPYITDAQSQAIASRLMLAAIENNDEQTVKALLAKGFNPNMEYDRSIANYKDYYSTPLMQAIVQKNAEIVQLLLEAGADPNRYASLRSTKDARFPSVYPLIYAAENGLTTIVKLLLENPFTQQIQKLREEQGTQSYLGLLPRELITSSSAYIKINPNITNNWNQTALQRAAAGDHLEIVNLLLQAGAQIDTQDVSGITALMEAARAGNFEIFKRLIQAGADPKLTDKRGKSVYFYATESKSLNKKLIIYYLDTILKTTQPS